MISCPAVNGIICSMAKPSATLHPSLMHSPMASDIERNLLIRVLSLPVELRRAGTPPPARDHPCPLRIHSMCRHRSSRLLRVRPAADREIATERDSPRGSKILRCLPEEFRRTSSRSKPDLATPPTCHPSPA